jgi:hypothetical protein
MLLQAATRKNPNRIQELITASIPASTGGWNDRDSLALTPPQDAVIQVNYFSQPSKVILRAGEISWATGIGSPTAVQTVMGYQPQSGTAKLFAAAGANFYDVTASGAVGAAVVTGNTNAQWQKINITTGGGSYLMAVNGKDKLRGWDGSAWWKDGDGAHDITGVDTSTCTSIALQQKRVWLIQPSTCSAWFLAVNSIAGAASQFPLGTIFYRGGTLVGMANWSLDAGAGLQSFTAFFSNQGEVAIYQGSDPSSATTWSLVGVYWTGSPIGTRFALQAGRDVLVLTKEGCVPLSQALITGRIDTKIAITDKIQNTVSASINSYGSNFGWQIMQYPDQNMILLNIPVGTGVQEQYVMNTITGAWARFKGWPANCWELFNDDIYFGENGIVRKAWQGTSDHGTAIAGEVLQAFNYFKEEAPADSLKEFTMCRPLIAVDGNPGLQFGINTDFDMTAPHGVPTFLQSGTGQWNTGQWGSAQWGGNPAIQKAWQSAFGTGYCAAAHLVSLTTGVNIQWSATDYGFKMGGVL